MTINYTPLESDDAADAATLNSPLEELDAAIKKNNWTAVTDPGVGDDANDNYSAGSRWLNTATSRLYTCVDATVGAAIWVTFDPTGPRQLLVNGGFEIWQRGAGPFNTTAAYSADRWKQTIGAASTLTTTKETGAGNVDSALTSSTSLKAVYVHSALSYYAQTLETEHTKALRSQYVACSGRILTSTAAAIRLALFDGVAVVYSATHTGSGTFETLSCREKLAVNATNLQLIIYLLASGTFYIDNLMLSVGPFIPSYIPDTPAVEYERCQRYYEVLGGVSGTAPSLYGHGPASPQAFGAGFVFAAAKAIVPTVTKNGTWSVVNCGQPAVGYPSLGGCAVYAVSSGENTESFCPADATCTVTAEANPV